MVYIAAAVWVSCYIYYTSLTIMSERIGLKYKVNYLKALLKQDIAWFDSINSTELSSKLTRECQTIQKALGDKMGMTLRSLAMSVSGLFFAFFRGWYFSLLLLAAFPTILIMSMVMGAAMQSGFS